MGCCLTRSMSAALNLKSNNIFEAVPEGEMEALYSDIYQNASVLVGRCEDGSVIVFRPGVKIASFIRINGSYRSSSKAKDPIEATFSFVLNETKYLFKAALHKKGRRQGELNLLTMMFRIQRRSVKRLKVPSDYYAVVRLSHQNSRLIRSFGKLMDISPRGLGIILPNPETKVKVGDLLRVVLTISQRPPETIELRVVHLRAPNKMEDNSNEKGDGQFFGAVCLPENSITVFKRMNAIVMDVYRDIFGSLTENKK